MELNEISYERYKINKKKRNDIIDPIKKNKDWIHFIF